MGRNTLLKDFVQRQTESAFAIEIKESKRNSVPETKAAAEEAAHTQIQEEKKTPKAAPERTKGSVGRPKAEVEKVRFTIYAPAEHKSKIEKLQHLLGKNSVSELLTEAIEDLLNKYHQL